MKKHQFREVANSRLDNERENSVIEFHVVPQGDRWDVERDDMFTGSFAHNVHVAIGLAVAAAQRDYHNGEEVMVCVHELDGHCRKVWP